MGGRGICDRGGCESRVDHAQSRPSRLSLATRKSGTWASSRSRCREARRGGGFRHGPVTSGPYEVKQWKPDEKLVLQPNPHYWRRRANPVGRHGRVDRDHISRNPHRYAEGRRGRRGARAVPWAQIRRAEGGRVGRYAARAFDHDLHDSAQT
ncbi:ABC transporter substrate-binding protein [Rhizobium beringeri]